MMGETELEEGEAGCSDMENDPDIDIDVALSHIDERIQDVLGCYQKEFEGEISVENLGARFGGYGSFLPTYQRSPSIWSQSRTPQKGQNNSSHDRPSEGAPRSSKVFVRPQPASTDLPLPESRNSSADSSAKVGNSGDCVSNHEPVKLPINQSNKRTLKIWIKVGPDNVLTQKNAAIYSNLGLDMSPSSASEDSPAEWEGNSPDSLEKQGESPSCIIKIMTSFPIPNGVPLSPLHDSLLCLMEEKRLLDGSRSGPNQESCAVLENEVVSCAVLENDVASKMLDIKVLGEKKRKLGNKSGILAEPKNEINKDTVTPGLKKEVKLKTLTGKETVYDNLKIPPESNKFSEVSDMADGTVVASEANKGVAKDRFVSSNIVNEETLGSISRLDSLAEKVQNDKNIGRDIRKDGGTKGDGSLDLFEEDWGMPKGRLCNWGTVAPSRQNCETHQQDRVEMPHGKEQSSSGGEKKYKGSQNYGSLAARTSKESLRVSSSSASQDNITYETCFSSKSKEDDKLQKDLRKVRGGLSDTTENTKLEKKECKCDTLRTPLKDQAKDSKLEVSGKKSHSFNNKSKERLGEDQTKDSKLEVTGKISHIFSNKKKERSGKDQSKDIKFKVSRKESHAISKKSNKTSVKGQAKDYKLEVSEKASHAFCNKSKERSGGKKNDILSTSNVHLKGSLKDATPLSGLLPTEVAPVVIEENWVCCDKCQRWRLLPYGTNPDLLPKKWLCSMLNWLPGMNRCSVSEQDTTNALNALYQIPVSEIQNNQQSYPSGTAYRGTLVEAQNLNQNVQDLSFSIVLSGGKKKLKAKAVSNAAHHSNSVDILNFTKKNQHIPLKSKGLQRVSQCSLELKLENRSGDAKPLKTKSKRESDQDGFKPFKKTKTENMHFTNQDRNSGWFSMKEIENDSQKYNECSSNNIKGVPMDSLLPSENKSKNQVHKAMAVEDRDKSTIAGKKRKLKDRQDTQIHMDGRPCNMHHIKDKQIAVKEETSGSECMKEMKARESKFQGKESKTSKASGEPDQKGKVTRVRLSSIKDDPLNSNSLYKKGKSTKKDQPLGQYDGHNLSQWTVKNTSRRDSVVGKPCMAANSSSSMISGTCNNKQNFQEAKGSPAESVCSSRLRISNPKNLTRSLSGKDGGANVGFCLLSSPAGCLVGEGDGGSNWSKSLSKEKAFPLIHQGTLDHVQYEVGNDCAPYKNDVRVGKITIHGNKSTKVEKSNAGKKVSDGKCSSDGSKRENQFTCGGLGDPHWKMDAVCQKDGKSTATENMLQNHNDQRSSKWLPSRNDQVEVAAGNDGDSAKVSKLHEKDDCPNGLYHVSSRDSTSNGHGIKDIVERSHKKKDTSSHAANNTLKEAKDLKHSADHLKISGSGLESTKVRFQAALKFLHGASLLDPCNSESAKYGDTEVYNTSVKLCEYCACEYERCEDMASAALAYKCMEVAYMRVIYSNHFIASSDRHELESTLQIISPVESPSSSASVVDNLNNQATMDNMDVAKDGSSLQVTGNHVIAARNMPNFVRLLNFAQDVNFAMEASRKSQIAFAAATVVLAEMGNEEGISSVKRVLDFSFHDVEELLRLVHLAMKALSGS